MSITTDHHPLGVPATEFCAISAGTRLLGDRWTLMVVHEMLGGARRFNEIHRGLPSCRDRCSPHDCAISSEWA